MLLKHSHQGKRPEHILKVLIAGWIHWETLIMHPMHQGWPGIWMIQMMNSNLNYPISNRGQPIRVKKSLRALGKVWNHLKAGSTHLIHPRNHLVDNLRNLQPVPIHRECRRNLLWAVPQRRMLKLMPMIITIKWVQIIIIDVDSVHNRIPKPPLILFSLLQIQGIVGLQELLMLQVVKRYRLRVIRRMVEVRGV